MTPSSLSRAAAASRRQVLALAVLLSTLGLAPAGHAVVSRSEHLRLCLICHINWGDDFKLIEPLLPPLKHPVLLDGEPAYNSSEAMCYSCHDGYVQDSRAKFGVDDPHLKKLPAGFSTGHLPLDQNGEMYCGTCHTPHTHKMGRKYSFTPFIRDGILASELCLNCHGDHTGSAGNHPLHRPLSGGRGAELANSFTPRDRVECLSCHKMHSAHPTRLTQGENRSQLCAACHTPQQDVLATRHNLSSSQPEARDACSVCHAPHPVKGQPAVRDGAICQRCHSAPLGHAEDPGRAWGHPLGAVPAASAGLPLNQGQMSCLTCHDPHRWASDGSGDPGGRGDGASCFLRRPDQAEGGLCLGCHPQQAAILQSDHGAGEAAFVSLSEGAVWRCTSCHDAHGAGVMQDAPASSPALAVLSPATRLCLRCHQDGGPGAVATNIGRFSHPLGMGIGAMRASWLPGDVDKPVGCETCHNPHQWSVTGEAWAAGGNGGAASSFLRADNREGALCMDCHENKATVLGSLHDQRNRPGASADACAACHSPHQAATSALLSARVAGTNLDHLLPESDWAVGSREHQPANWTEGAIGCLACHHSKEAGQRVPEAWVHPTWKSDAPPEMVPDRLKDLHIDCRTCHDPHVPWRPGHERARVEFLSAASSETLCSTCHGDEAIWRYNYFHNPLRRKP